MTKSVRLLFLPAVISAAILAGCGGGGGGSSSTTTTSSGGSSGSSGGGSTPVNNTAQLIVDEGPPAAVAAGLVADNDIAFVTINVCLPNSSTCQQIDHVQVDTGSSGLRLAAGVVTNISLPQQTTFECLGFADGTFVWGPLANADIQIAGEVAHNVPVQLASSSVPPASAGGVGCAPPGQLVSVAQFGANGILGLGVMRYDCGQGGSFCTSAGSSQYFGPNCASGSCNPVAQSPSAQVQNPVPLFASDNNGVILQLPLILASGQPTATGSLIFGIGTQTDNGVGSAAAIIPDPSTAEFAAKFDGVLYNDVNGQGPGGTGGAAIIDSGSNGLFFLDSPTLSNPPPFVFNPANQTSGFGINMPDCASSGPQALPGFYCPGGLTTINGGSTGLTIFSESSQDIPVGSGKAVTLNVGNGFSLINTPNTAFDDLGGENPNAFDLGLPFFFGQSVFFGIEGQSTPLGTGPLYAF
jgi:hypothetical protein